jgi:hypothetical protein
VAHWRLARLPRCLFIRPIMMPAQR